MHRRAFRNLSTPTPGGSILPGWAGPARLARWFGLGVATVGAALLSTALFDSPAHADTVERSGSLGAVVDLAGQWDAGDRHGGSSTAAPLDQRGNPTLLDDRAASSSPDRLTGRPLSGPVRVTTSLRSPTPAVGLERPAQSGPQTRPTSGTPTGATRPRPTEVVPRVVSGIDQIRPPREPRPAPVAPLLPADPPAPAEPSTPAAPPPAAPVQEPSAPQAPAQNPSAPGVPVRDPSVAPPSGGPGQPAVPAAPAPPTGPVLVPPSLVDVRPPGAPVALPLPLPGVIDGPGPVDLPGPGVVPLLPPRLVEVVVDDVLRPVLGLLPRVVENVLAPVLGLPKDILDPAPPTVPSVPPPPAPLPVDQRPSGPPPPAVPPVTVSPGVVAPAAPATRRSTAVSTGSTPAPGRLCPAASSATPQARPGPTPGDEPVSPVHPAGPAGDQATTDGGVRPAAALPPEVTWSSGHDQDAATEVSPTPVQGRSPTVAARPG